MITLALQSKESLGGNVWSFIFEPSSSLNWTAGQFIRIELPHSHPDEEGTKRQFTIASAPYERHIQIITRITHTSFKQALAKLPMTGKITLLDPPAGDFIWPPSHLLPVFVAQGIGITPFYSMLKQRQHEGKPLRALLMYANLSQPITFEKELTTWATENPELKLMFQNQPITTPILAETLPELKSCIIYVSGPRPLVKLLMPPYNLPANQLRQDTFPNYSASNY